MADSKESRLKIERMLLADPNTFTPPKKVTLSFAARATVGEAIRIYIKYSINPSYKLHFEEDGELKKEVFRESTLPAKHPKKPAPLKEVAFPFTLAPGPGETKRVIGITASIAEENRRPKQTREYVVIEQEKS